MRIVSHRKQREFYETPERGDSRVALERWYDIVENIVCYLYILLKGLFNLID